MPTTETTPKSKAKKGPAAPAPIIPVSAETNIEVKVFDPPQNDMRGFAIASDTVNGKWVRLAHAYLWTDRPSELTLDSNRRKMTSVDLARINEILALFVVKLDETDASR